MERYPYRPIRGAAARLWLEALEDRSLLAVAAFAINLYADSAGAPGEPIDDGTLEVGESFFLEITAQEFDPRLSGLRAVALDIAWDPAALQAIDSPFAPSAVITPLLPAFQSGTLDAASGTIDNLAGAAFLASNEGRAIGDAGPEWFALLHFRAVAAASGSPITLSEGKSNIVAVPTATFAAEQFDFARPLITVVEPAAAAAETAVQYYQGTHGSPDVPLSVEALEPGRGFYVEISAPPSAAPDAMKSAADGVLASLPGYRHSGWFLITTIQVQSPGGAVELPLAARPIDALASLPAAATRLGLTYLPAPAIDAVFAAAGELEFPDDAALDDGWMQALASGLACAEVKDAPDPFTTH
jgi:hypothetical protein